MRTLSNSMQQIHATAHVNTPECSKAEMVRRANQFTLDKLDMLQTGNYQIKVSFKTDQSMWEFILTVNKEGVIIKYHLYICKETLNYLLLLISGRNPVKPDLKGDEKYYIRTQELESAIFQLLINTDQYHPLQENTSTAGSYADITMKFLNGDLHFFIRNTPELQQKLKSYNPHIHPEDEKIMQQQPVKAGLLIEGEFLNQFILESVNSDALIRHEQEIEEPEWTDYELDLYEQEIENQGILDNEMQMFDQGLKEYDLFDPEMY